MTATFENSETRFDYPENWSLDYESDDANLLQVVVSSSQTAFWQLSKYPPDAELEALFDEALGALRSEYPEIEVEPSRHWIEGQEIDGYTANFFYLDLTNTSVLHGFKTPQSTYLIVCQAEDREFDQMQLVFEAMLTSLLRNVQ